TKILIKINRSTSKMATSLLLKNHLLNQLTMALLFSALGSFFNTVFPSSVRMVNLYTLFPIPRSIPAIQTVLNKHHFQYGLLSLQEVERNSMSRVQWNSNLYWLNFRHP